MVDEPVRGRVPDPSFWSLPGIEQARAYLRGVVPRSPLSHLIGFRLTQVGSGSATYTMPGSPWLLGPDGAMEVRILLEEALAMAVITGVPPATQVRTAALSVNQLRHSGAVNDTFVARARTLNTASTFTLADVQVEDGMGRAVAHATGSFLVLPIDPPPRPWGAGSEPVEEPIYPTPDPPLRPLADAFPFGVWAHNDALSVMRRYLAGEFPELPLLRLLDFRMTDANDGVCAGTLNTSEWLCSRSRRVAPGILAFVGYFGLAGAVLTLAPAGHGVGIVEESITLLRAVPADGREVLTRGIVVHQARDLIVSNLEVTDADGNRVALGYETAVIKKQRPKSPASASDRILATVLFTDIVGSTQRAAELGDAGWSRLLDQHHALVRQQLAHFKGREVKTTGDGFLAIFDSPGRAVQAARVIRDSIRRLGLQVRAGLHTGECEVSGADVTGIAVHIAARVAALAGGGEVLVTGTVRDLVTGSGLRFTDRGAHQLKGIDGDWHLFALAE